MSGFNNWTGSCCHLVYYSRIGFFCLLLSAALCSGHTIPAIEDIDGGTSTTKPCLWISKNKHVQSHEYKNFNETDCQKDSDDLSDFAHCQARTNQKVHQRCICGAIKSQMEFYCPATRFNCSRHCTTDSACFNKGNINPCEKNQHNCTCNIPIGLVDIHKQTPFRGKFCENVLEHRHCTIVDEAHDTIDCEIAESNVTNCHFTQNNIIFHCTEVIFNIHELSSEKLCIDLINDNKPEQTPDGEVKNIKFTKLTEWFGTPFENGRLEVQMGLVCSAEKALDELDLKEIENGCYVFKTYVRYCENNNCSQKLGGPRKIFEKMFRSADKT